MSSRTIPREWVKKVRAKTPELLQVGKQPPKAVLSFGGCGFLVTYSLGVAAYLQEEKKEFLAECFLLGAGTGVIPAVALACGAKAINIESVRDFIVDHRFWVTDEDKRIAIMTEGINNLLPRNAIELINGRVALTIGFSNKDPGYMQQSKENIYYGHHIAKWNSYDDLAQNILAATAPNTNKPMIFRDADNVLRGTMMSLSSEINSHCRHIFIHGYCGYKYNQHQTRHNIIFGKNSYLGNTHFPFYKQALLSFFPTLGLQSARREELLHAFDAGMQDARMYERWEEDAYYYAKAERRSEVNSNFNALKAAMYTNANTSDRYGLESR